MPNSDPEGQIFLSASNNHGGFFFLHTLWSPAFDFNVGARGGILGINLVQGCRWASSYPPYNCIPKYGKNIPINVYKKRMTRSGRCFYSKGIDPCRKLSTVKYWIINWFLPENSQITWRDKGQVARLSTAGDWMEGYKCIFKMKSWPIDVLMTWKWGLFQRHVCTIQYIGSYTPPPPRGVGVAINELRYYTRWRPPYWKLT